MAIGKPSYGKFAWNLAVSIKAHSDVNVCVIHDDVALQQMEDWRLKFFDKQVVIDKDDCYQDFKFQPGKAKISLYKYLPYDENMIIDADSLCIRDVNELFELCNKDIIAQSVGSWDETADLWTCQWMPIDKVKEVYNLPKHFRIFEINSSFLFIRKGKVAEKFYEQAMQNFYTGYQSEHLHKWGGTFPDELAYNVAFAQLNIHPIFDDQLPETLSNDGQKPIYFSTRYVNNWGWILSNYHFLGYYGDKHFTALSLQDQYDRFMVANLANYNMPHHYKINHLMKSKHILSK